MKFRITNLTGTKRDPKKRRKTSATSKPVRIGKRHLPPAKSMYLTLDLAEMYREQLSFYMTHEMISVAAPTLDALALFEKTVYGKDEPVEEPKQEVVEEKVESKKVPVVEEVVEVVATPAPEAPVVEEAEVEAPAEKPAPKKTRKKRTTKKKKASTED